MEGVSWPKAFLAALLLAVGAFWIGWLSRKVKTRRDVVPAMHIIFNDRDQEAAIHGITGALPILARTRADVVSRLDQLLPPP